MRVRTSVAVTTQDSNGISYQLIFSIQRILLSLGITSVVECAFYCCKIDAFGLYAHTWQGPIRVSLWQLRATEQRK